MAVECYDTKAVDHLGVMKYRGSLRRLRAADPHPAGLNNTLLQTANRPYGVGLAARLAYGIQW